MKNLEDFEDYEGFSLNAVKTIILLPQSIIPKTLIPANHNPYILWNQLTNQKEMVDEILINEPELMPIFEKVENTEGFEIFGCMIDEEFIEGEWIINPNCNQIIRVNWYNRIIFESQQEIIKEKFIKEEGEITIKNYFQYFSQSIKTIIACTVPNIISVDLKKIPKPPKEIFTLLKDKNFVRSSIFKILNDKYVFNSISNKIFEEVYNEQVQKFKDNCKESVKDIDNEYSTKIFSALENNAEEITKFLFL